MTDTSAEVCIVGGGIGGLAAAHDLRKRGISSVILEASDRLGGRIKTQRMDGCSFDVGAVGLLGSYKATEKLIHEIGLGGKLSKESVCLAVPRNGELHQFDMAKPLSILRNQLLSKGSLLKAAKLGGPMLKHWKQLQFDSIAAMQPHDTDTVDHYSRSNLNDELYDFLISPMIRALWQRDAEGAPLIDLFWSLKAFAPSMYALNDGMDLLPNALAQQSNAITGAVVHEVEDSPGGAIVSYSKNGQSHSKPFRACVMAVPSTVCANLLKPMPENLASALQQLPYSCSVNVHFSLDRRIGGNAQIIFPPESIAPDLTTLVFEHNKGPGRAAANRGSISTFWRDSWSRPRMSTDNESIVKDAISQIRLVLPDFDDSAIINSHVERWDYAGVCRQPGGSKAVVEIEDLRRKLRSVTLAGDYYSLSGVNAALISGQRAAREIKG